MLVLGWSHSLLLPLLHFVSISLLIFLISLDIIFLSLLTFSLNWRRKKERIQIQNVNIKKENIVCFTVKKNCESTLRISKNNLYITYNSFFTKIYFLNPILSITIDHYMSSSTPYYQFKISMIFENTKWKYRK